MRRPQAIARWLFRPSRSVPIFWERADGRGKKSRFGRIVIDDDYVNGASKSIANDLNLKTGKQMHTMGLKDRTAGFHKAVDNLPPNAEEICKQIEKIVNKN